jgi:hypothetical protein
MHGCALVRTFAILDGRTLARLVRTNRLKTGRPSLPGVLDWIICCRSACISCCFLYCDRIWGGTLGLPFFMSKNRDPPASLDFDDDGAQTTTDPPKDDTLDDAECNVCCWVVQAVAMAASRLADTSRFTIGPCFRITTLLVQRACFLPKVSLAGDGEVTGVVMSLRSTHSAG